MSVPGAGEFVGGGTSPTEGMRTLSRCLLAEYVREGRAAHGRAHACGVNVNRSASLSAMYSTCRDARFGSSEFTWTGERAHSDGRRWRGGPLAIFDVRHAETQRIANDLID
ncbi:hypothetical protein GCM10022254_14610 [Actinomadura meridiana]|uniref:Uncharacterized protein n=1 Tax=Actinomadura meridiana TaxID=559626 RepID=A0ABP8BVL9_9ACTN